MRSRCRTDSTGGFAFPMARWWPLKTATWAFKLLSPDATLGILWCGGVTEVVRGADLLKSTARQILLYRALGFEPPAWFHCKLVVDHNGRRLAKRHDALSLRALRKRGLTPMNILSADLGA